MKGKHWTITSSTIGGKPQQPEPDQTLRFRLFDDDDNMYFEGVMKPTSSERLFDPLDDYGVAFGCTHIKVFEKGAWTHV